MMLFTLALSLSLIPFFSPLHKQQFHLHSRPLISKGPRLNQDTRGLKQRGTCWRIYCWIWSLRLRPDWAQGGRKQALSLWKSPQCLVMSSWLWSLLSMDKNTTQTRLCGSLQTCQASTLEWAPFTLLFNPEDKERLATSSRIASYKPTINASQTKISIKNDAKLWLLRLRKSTQKTFNEKKNILWHKHARKTILGW